MKHTKLYTAHLNVKLAPQMLADLHALALSKHLTVSELIRKWVSSHIELQANQ